MRLPAICLVGLLLAACGLSMNPDLPSTKEAEPPFFGDGDGNTNEGSDLDSAGDGLGGASSHCKMLGGAAGNSTAGSPDCEKP